MYNPSEHSNPPSKRRRGRQPRPSSLSSTVKAAVAQFAHHVGQPRVIEPAGFRDFRGWLSYVGSPSAATAWAPLVDAVLNDTKGDRAAIEALKDDLVREIVKRVVIPRASESSKLVSTNCGRQCARPPNGTTLMTILDRVFHDPAEWRTFIDTMSQHAPHRSQHPPSSSSSHAPFASSSSSSSSHQHHHAASSSMPSSSSMPPSHHHASSSRHARASNTPLPSFQELEDSLRHTSSSRGKRSRR